MINNINKYIDFLMEHDITERQFTLLFLLYTDAYAERPDGSRLYANRSTAERPIAKLMEFFHFHDRRGRVAWDREKDIDYLEKKGFITKLGNKYSPELLKLEDKFIEAIFATESDFEVFYRLYPSHIDNFNNPAGPKIPLKAVDKDSLFELYKRKVLTKDEHNVLIRVIKWGKQHNQINMNIAKYVGSEQWKEDLKLIKEYQSDKQKFNSREL